MPTPEDKARENIDWLLTPAWAARDQSDANIIAHGELPSETLPVESGNQ